MQPVDPDSDDLDGEAFETIPWHGSFRPIPCSSHTTSINPERTSTDLMDDTEGVCSTKAISITDSTVFTTHSKQQSRQDKYKHDC